jgi:hypothetical protein
LIIVASELDPATERIVRYLQDEFKVPINAVFFRYFVDEDAEYLARSWLTDPVEAEARATSGKRVRADVSPFSDSDYYVCLGEDGARTWADARRFGFVSAGGGERWRKAISRLRIGDRVYAYVPGAGYVGAGEVTAVAVPARDFTVEVNGVGTSVLDAEGLAAPAMDRGRDDEEMCEYVVRVRWDRTLDRADGYTEKGLLAIPSTVARLRIDALEKLKTKFAVGPSQSHDGHGAAPAQALTA